ncbi:MAG TPA: OmpA family protein [Stellaceae bacterium]|nr:OmpA family protein [Stellaceae bacterium]
MKPFRLIPFLAAALLVAGCSSFRVGPDQDAAQAMGPPQDPFRAALASGYKSLGANQYAEADYVSSDVYYRKSQAAAAGAPVPLEDSANWTSLTAADRQDVANMRPQLQSWIDANSQRDPQGAANQQLHFDCWIEEMNEGEYADAAACKPGVAVAQAVVQGCAANPNGLDANGKLCQEGVVYFAWDRYDLLNPRETDIKQSVDAQAAALDLIVRQVNTIKPARIDVIGRADASGPEDYNYGLSECRARTVADALRARGLPAGIDIRTIPLGKTDLVVPTADGVRDPANRVVMVAYQTDRNAPPARQPASRPKKDLFNCGGPKHPYPPRG